MIDFKGALTEGFEAAKRAEAARSEIQQVLAKLRSDLLEATDGKLLVELGYGEEPDPVLIRIQRPQSASSMINSIFAPKVPAPMRRFLALLAKNSKSSAAKVVARWKQAAEGYPCTITWNNQEHECLDREALERSLGELLRSPVTGEILATIMRS